MARRVKDSNLADGTARLGLKVRTGSISWRLIGAGLHLGWRRGKTDGRWLIRRYQGAGKYAVETLAAADDYSDADGAAILNFHQAQEAARARVAAIAEAAKSSPYTVGNALDDYVKWLEDEGKASAYDVGLRLKACVADELRNVELANLTAPQLKAWHRALAKKPARVRSKSGKQKYRSAPKSAEERRKRAVSANRVLASVKAAFNHAWGDEKVPTDVAWRRVKPIKKIGSQTVNKARAVFFELDECRRLINAAQGDFRMLTQAALETGCRYGELVRLTVGDFKSNRGTLHIRESKSGKERDVILTDDGIALFTRITMGRQGDDVMLLNGDREWRRSEQRPLMIEACKGAGVRPAGFHQLRHTYASHAVMNKMPLIVLATNLGHSDTRMVEEHYGHLRESYVHDEIRAGAPRYGIVAETSNVRAIR